MGMLEFLGNNGIAVDRPLKEQTFMRFRHNCGNGEAAWAKFWLTPVPRGICGCHRCGLHEKWSSRPLTVEELQVAREAVAKDTDGNEEQAEQTSVMINTHVLPELYLAKPDHPYLVAKNIKVCGALQVNSALVLPLRDIHNKIWSTQLICAEPVKHWGGRTKSFTKGGRVNGCFFLIGTLNILSEVLICEGYATGATLNEATGLPVACAMSAGNLKAVAVAFRHRFLDAKIIICGDNDRHTKGNPGLTAADAAEWGARAACVVPDLSEYPAERGYSDFNDLARLKGLGAVREAVAKAVHPMKPIIYYEATTMRWWSLGKDYVRLDSSAVKSALHMAGFSRSSKGDMPSAVEIEMHRISHYDNIHYAGPLAGRQRGIHHVGDSRVLVTTSCPIKDGVEGDFENIHNLLTGVLGPEQSKWLFLWCYYMRRRLLNPGEWFPLPAVGFAGAAHTWKSCIQQMIAYLAGGRIAKPARFLQGLTEFNSELFGAEMLVMEDETGNADAKSRRSFGEQIKSMLFCRSVQCHAKGRNGLTLDPIWAMTLSINDDPEHAMAMPRIDNSLKDKIALLKTCEVRLLGGASEIDYVKKLTSEIPAFAWSLDNEIDPESELFNSFRDSRCLIKTIHNGEIMGVIEENTVESRLMALIDYALFDGEIPVSKWEGTAEALTRKLRETNQYEVDKILQSSISCGRYLSRLSEHQAIAGRIVYKRTMKSRIWTIFAPQLNYLY